MTDMSNELLETANRIDSALTDFELWDVRLRTSEDSAIVGLSRVDMVRAVLSALVSQGVLSKETSGSRQRADGSWGRSVRYVSEWVRAGKGSE